MDQRSEDERFMARALELASVAADAGEVPVGALLVLDGAIIAEAWNTPIKDCDPSAHAEMRALRIAGERLQNYRLLKTTLYVTLEPCIMCAGAIIHARVDRVVFGAADPKTGAAGSLFDILGTDRLNHKVQVEQGVLADDCSQLLKRFFKAKR